MEANFRERKFKVMTLIIPSHTDAKILLRNKGYIRPVLGTVSFPSQSNRERVNIFEIKIVQRYSRRELYVYLQ